MVKKCLLILAVLWISNSLSAQNRIYGVVVNKNGKSIPGVNIVIDNTVMGTVSDDKGHFEIIATNHPTELSVKFFFIGYQPGEMVVIPEDNFDYQVKIVLLKTRQKRDKDNILNSIDKVPRK